MFLFQNRVGGKHPGSGLESSRKEFWGAPFHGATDEGITLLPNAEFKTFPVLAGAHPRAYNANSAIPFQNPYVALPSLVRSAEELAIDTAEGFQWKDYGLLCGTYKALYGQYEIGHAGWLYAAPDGSVWRIWLHEYERVAPPTSGLYATTAFTLASVPVTVKARRFGMVRSQVEGEVGDDTVYSYSKSLDAVLGFIGPLTARVAVGTMSLAGEKVMMYLIHPDALTPPVAAFPFPFGAPFWGGWPELGLGRTRECWVADCTGTPGIDFDITITPYDHGTDIININDDFFDNFIHAWVTPGGVVEEFRHTKDTLQDICVGTNTLDATCATANPGPPCESVCGGLNTTWAEDANKLFATPTREIRWRITTPGGDFDHVEQHVYSINSVVHVCEAPFIIAAGPCAGTYVCWSSTSLIQNREGTFNGDSYFDIDTPCSYTSTGFGPFCTLQTTVATLAASCAAILASFENPFPILGQHNGADCIHIRTLIDRSGNLSDPANYTWTAVTTIGTFTFAPTVTLDIPFPLTDTPPKVFFDGGDPATLLPANFAGWIERRAYV